MGWEAGGEVLETGRVVFVRWEDRVVEKSFSHSFFFSWCGVVCDGKGLDGCGDSFVYRVNDGMNCTINARTIRQRVSLFFKHHTSSVNAIQHTNEEKEELGCSQMISPRLHSSYPLPSAAH